MKASYLCSEFWLTLALNLLNAFVVSGIFPDTHWSVKVASMLVAGLSLTLYGQGRSNQKQAVISNQSAVPPPPVWTPEIPNKQ